jgi:hypothetical protein
MLRHRQIPDRRISCPLPVDLLTADGERLPLSGDLSFDSTDPIAVKLSIRAAVDKTVIWIFARELLDAGLHGGAGEGDVRVRTTHTIRGKRLTVVLASPDGVADLELPAHRVAAFLRHTYDVVPAEAEGDSIDWSSEIDALLGRGGARTDNSTDR